jgi:hypothetical protein
MRSFCLWLFAVLLGSTLGASAQPTLHVPAPHLRLIDLTGDFATAWAQGASLPDAERAAQFKLYFATRLPGFYDHHRMGRATEQQYDAQLLRGLRRFPEQRAGIEDVSRRFSGMLGPALRSFEAAFGPMRGYPPVYLVHSMGEMDGGTRDLPEGTRLIFGADMIHQLYQGVSVQPFFHHELFHLLHGQTFSECEPIWCSLWIEGLAVYVSARLNPRASDRELLLTVPVPLRAAVERDRAAAICPILGNLQSTDRSVYGAMFMGGAGEPGTGLPPRYGYYVGYLVAQEAGRTRSLRQLAAMRHEEVRPLVERILRRLATCPPAPAAA